MCYILCSGQYRLSSLLSHCTRVSFCYICPLDINAHMLCDLWPLWVHGNDMLLSQAEVTCCSPRAAACSTPSLILLADMTLGPCYKYGWQARNIKWNVCCAYTAVYVEKIWSSLWCARIHMRGGLVACDGWKNEKVREKWKCIAARRQQQTLGWTTKGICGFVSIWFTQFDVKRYK